MKIKKGVTRIVFFVGKYAIKIPNFTFCQLHFVQGCSANLSERMYCKQTKPIPDLYDLVAPSLFCSWMGLLQIMVRVNPIPKNINIPYERFKNICTDNKPNNYGIYQGRIVCLDYGGPT